MLKSLRVVTSVSLCIRKIDDNADRLRSSRLASDGIHLVRFRSIDAAGNIEAAKLATVRIDNDAPLFAAVALAVLATSAAVAWLPARRALSISPSIAMRE